MQRPMRQAGPPSSQRHLPARSPPVVSPHLRQLLDDLAADAVTHLVIGHSPLLAVHSQCAHTLSAHLARCTSVLSLTIRLRHCSPQALEVLLRGAAQCASLQRVSVLGGVGLADAQALAAGLAAFRRDGPAPPAPAPPPLRDSPRARPCAVKAVRVAGGGIGWGWAPMSARRTPPPPLAVMPRRLPCLSALSPASTATFPPVHLEMEFATLDEKSAAVIFLRGLEVGTRVMSATVREVGLGGAGGVPSAVTRRALHKFASRVDTLLCQRRRDWTAAHTPRASARAPRLTAAPTALAEAARSPSPRCPYPCVDAPAAAAAAPAAPARAPPSVPPHTPPRSPPVTGAAGAAGAAGPSVRGRLRHKTGPAEVGALPARCPSGSPETQRNRRRTAFFLQLRRDRRPLTPPAVPSTPSSSPTRRYSPARWLKDVSGEASAGDAARPRSAHTPRETNAEGDQTPSSRDARPFTPLPPPPSPRGVTSSSLRTRLSLFVHRSTSGPSPAPRAPEATTGASAQSPTSSWSSSSATTSRTSDRRRSADVHAHVSARTDPSAAATRTDKPPSARTRVKQTDAREARADDANPHRSHRHRRHRALSRPSSAAPRAALPELPACPASAAQASASSPSCRADGRDACFVCQPPLPAHAPTSHEPPRSSASPSSAGLTPARELSPDDEWLGHHHHEDSGDGANEHRRHQHHSTTRAPLRLERALIGGLDDQPRDHATPTRLHPLHPHHPPASPVASSPLVLVPCTDSFCAERAMPLFPPLPPPDQFARTAEGPPAPVPLRASETRVLASVELPPVIAPAPDLEASVSVCVARINASLAAHNARATLEVKRAMHHVDALNTALTNDVTAQMTEMLVAVERWKHNGASAE